MTVYVDPCMARGWRLRGHLVHSCHMFTDQAGLAELHALAKAIGCERAWFQDHGKAPHYDLTATRRAAAIAAGAVEVTSRQAVHIWRNRVDKMDATIARIAAQVKATT